MTTRFAAAMRRAHRETCAFDPLAATATIQAALAVEAPMSRTREPAATASDPGPGRHRFPRRTSVPGHTGDRAAPSTTRSARRSANVLPARTSPGDLVRALRIVRPAAPSPGLPRQPGVAPTLEDGARFESRRFDGAHGARDYRLYVPASAGGTPRGLVVMLHGCGQTPEDFAAGTDMNAAAEREGLLVAYPSQTRLHNPAGAWNWFRPEDQQRDLGEPALLAGLTRHLVEEFDIPPERVFVAGLSAGGAMAAVLGETYPDLFAAAAVHSGLAHGAAHDVVSAFAAMRGQPGARRATPATRTIVFHGAADRTVDPSNGERVAGTSPDGAVTTSERVTPEDRRHATRTVVVGPDGRPWTELWMIDGAGHAWSGGSPAGSYTDPTGPDATMQTMAFFLAQPPSQPNTRNHSTS